MADVHRKPGAPGAVPSGDTALDAALLSELQERFPLSVTPFRELAQRLGTDEAAVLDRVVALHESGILRHVTPIFEPAALGYASSLVAMRVPEERLAAAVEAVNAHPGVSHNYRREHAFNLWFTIAVPPGLDLRAHIDRLHALASAASTRPLPTLRRFKIGVSLDLSGERAMDHQDDAPSGASGHGAAPAAPLTERDIGIIRAVQGNLPLQREPFADAARALGMAQSEVVAALDDLRARGCLRRVAGIVRHRQAGFTANGMGVWNVPDADTVAIGEAMARYSAISHCYERPRYPDWPYNLFTMIHARNRDECDAFVAGLARTHGIEDHAVLYSTVEYKKVRPVYFTPDIAAWEREQGLG